MAQLKSLIVNGSSRFIGDVFANTFTGNLSGTASYASNIGTTGGSYTYSQIASALANLTTTDTNLSSRQDQSELALSNKISVLETGFSDLNEWKNNPTAVTMQATCLNVGESINIGGTILNKTEYLGNAKTATSATNATNASYATYLGNSSSYYSYSSLGTTFLKLTGGNMSGTINSNFASNTWINSASNAVITCNYSGYGGIFCAPVNGGRIAVTTYPASNGDLYFLYFSSAQISSGDNSYTTSMVWDGANNALYAGSFRGSLDWSYVANKPFNTTVFLTASEYSALSSKDSSTIYFIKE